MQTKYQACLKETNILGNHNPNRHITVQQDALNWQQFENKGWLAVDNTPAVIKISQATKQFIQKALGMTFFESPNFNLYKQKSEKPLHKPPFWEDSTTSKTSN